MAPGHGRDRASDDLARSRKADPDVAGDRRRSRLERLEGIPLKFLRFTTVRDRTGLSRSTIWRLERQGAFPKHRRISANAVAWLEQEINDWVLSKAAAG
jgi:prophage regulatory protein